jgi:hypothetical protein
MAAPLVVSCLAKSKRDVAIFDHMLDLSPHCESHASASSQLISFSHIVPSW